MIGKGAYQRELTTEQLNRFEKVCSCHPGAWGLCVAPSIPLVPEIMVRNKMNALILGQAAPRTNTQDQLSDERAFISVVKAVSARYDAMINVPVIPVWGNPCQFFNIFKPTYWEFHFFSVVIIQKVVNTVELNAIFSSVLPKMRSPDGRIFVHYGYWEEERENPEMFRQFDMWEVNHWLRQLENVQVKG